MEAQQDSEHQGRGGRAIVVVMLLSAAFWVWLINALCHLGS